MSAGMQICRPRLQRQHATSREAEREAGDVRLPGCSPMTGGSSDWTRLRSGKQGDAACVARGGHARAGVRPP